MTKEVTILMQMRDRASRGFANVSKAFSRSMRDAEQSVKGLGRSLSNAVREMQQGTARAREFADGLQTIGIGAGIVAGAAGLMTKSFIDSAVQMEKMRMGLRAVSGSAEEAEAQLARLRKVAELPGLGLQEAIAGATRLQVVGTSAEDAVKQLTAFGNAIARVGGGRAELARVVEQFAQMSAKSEVLMEDFRPIVSLMPDVITAMEAAFGTKQIEQIREMGISSQEFIAGVTEELLKLEPVGKTAANSMENLSDKMFNLKASLGEALLPVFIEILDKVSSAVDWFNQLSKTEKSMIAWGGAITAGLGTIVAGLSGMVLVIPKVITALKAMKTAYLFLMSTQTLGLTTALGAAAVAAAGLYVGLKKVSDWYVENAIEKKAAKLAEGLKPMLAAEEYEELGKTLDRQRKKIAALHKEHANLVKTAAKTTLDALRPAAIEAQIKKIEAGIKQLERRRAKLAESVVTAPELGEIKRIAEKQEKDLEKLFRKPLPTTKVIKPFVEVEDKHAELIAKYNKERRDEHAKMLKRITEDELKEQRKRLDKQLDFEERLIKGTTALREKEAKEFQESAERYQERVRKEEEMTTEWFKKQSDKRIKASRKAYEQLSKQTKDFEYLVRDVQTGWAKITTEPIKESVGFLDILQAEFGDLNSIITKSSIALARWADDGKESLSNLEFATRGFAQAFTGDYIGLLGTIGEFGRGIWDTIRGIDRDVENAIKDWEKVLPGAITETILSGLESGFTADEIALKVEDLIYQNIIARAIAVLVADHPDLNRAIEEWARTLEEAMGEFSPAGKLISAGEEVALEVAAKNVKKFARGAAGYATALANTFFVAEDGIDKALHKWAESISNTVASTITSGIKEGLSAAKIGENIDKFLKEQIFEQAITTILTNLPVLKNAIEKWSQAVQEALSPEGAAGAEITDWEMKFIAAAGREIKWVTENVASEGMKLADTLGLSWEKNIREAGQTTKEILRQPFLDFTKAGIFPVERGMKTINLQDILMAPQRAAYGLQTAAAESTLLSGQTPKVSDVIEPKPGVTFVQNNTFHGLVNFDNPEAMRELAKKLQPYTEELQENWVS